MPTCRDCQAEISWPTPYTQGARPLNMDGTQHNCPKKQSSGGKGAKFEKTPINDANQYLAKALELSRSFIPANSDISPADRHNITVKIFDTLSRSYKL